jgi:hypothetical protein
MVSFAQKYWSKVCSGVLLAGVLGLGGVSLYERFAGDCCNRGAACCHPGAACCNHKVAAR